MRMHTTLILSGMAAGAVAAAMALAPNASAQTGMPSCHAAGEPVNVCHSRGDFQGDFSQPIQQPSQFQYPYGWLQGL
jgi:hypothetical protein